MVVDCLASQGKYATHLAPIWLALDSSERGTFYVVGGLANTIDAEGLPGIKLGYPPPGTTPTMVAGFVDEQQCRRPVIYVEHGSGQSYSDGGHVDPCYSGSLGHDRVILFLSPGETVADRWRRVYPITPAVAVGVPKLDWWHRQPRRQRNKPPVVAVTFHSEGPLNPETIGAWSHYDSALPALAAAYPGMLGHGHPGIWRRIELRWRELGVEPVADLNEVFARADLLVADNTSALPEAASLGIPLLWLNAPWYRRDVTHDSRFWSWPKGQVTCDEPGDLVAAVGRTIDDPQPVREAREAMVRSIYVACDGRATERAVAAIRDVSGDRS